MPILDIAFKDLVRSFRSSFLLGMMFVVPLLITGLIYFAFSGLLGSQGAATLPTTRVLVVNLDEPGATQGIDAGKQLVAFLQTEGLAFLQVALASSEAEARAAVDRGDAAMAIIIPKNLTAAVAQPDMRTSVVLYHDPTLTVAPGVVKTLVSDFLDGFSGAKIAVDVTAHQLSGHGQTLDDGRAQAVAQRYATWVQAEGHSHEGGAAGSVLITRAPAQALRPANAINGFLGPVMAGMLVFFVFYTGCATAQSILREDEEGTLARLFTTPVPRTAILGGKLIAVFATIIVQITVLLIASSLVFGIRWGDPLAIALNTIGLSVAAAGFGVCVMSFMKNSRQAGPVGSAIVTITGVLGGLIPLGDPSQPSPLDTIGLALPQGWALHGWKLSLAGASPNEAVLPLTVLLIAGTLFFAVGTLVFGRRFE